MATTTTTDKNGRATKSKKAKTAAATKPPIIRYFQLFPKEVPRPRLTLKILGPLLLP